MALNLPPSSTGEPPVTTETFQKHYGRGSVGYADDHPHHRGHPPSQQSYSPTQYAPPGHQHPPPPLPPTYNACPPPPPAHGYHHPSSWYYPPHATPGPVPPPLDDPASRRIAPRASKHMHPSLVTPKSQDSETLPPFVASSNGYPENKKRASIGTVKRTATPKKKEGGNKLPSSNNDKEPEMGEEPKVEPMKQDFHFYAMDHYEEVKQVCQQQLDNAFADGTIVQTNTENQLYLLTTLLNARLIKNWEDSSPSTRAEYLKKEEADRKRFMSEEEVASRHCATLTARRRSPKQSGDLGRAGSFGLSAVDVPSLGDGSGQLGVKRPKSEFDMNAAESSAKRAKAHV